MLHLVLQAWRPAGHNYNQTSCKSHQSVLDLFQIKLGKGSRSRRLLLPIGHPSCSLSLQILSLRNPFASMGDVSNTVSPGSIFQGAWFVLTFGFMTGTSSSSLVLAVLLLSKFIVVSWSDNLNLDIGLINPPDLEPLIPVPPNLDILTITPMVAPYFAHYPSVTANGTRPD